MDDASQRLHLLLVPTVELDDSELSIAIQSFRRLVELAIQDSKRQRNPQIKLTFMRIAQSHQDTVEKLERARASEQGSALPPS